MARFFSPILMTFYSLNKNHMPKDIIQGLLIEILTFLQTDSTP